MLGSFEDAEDLVQETLLRAWRGRASFQGRSLFRTWLYRIATNACLNALQRGPRRILVADVPPRDPAADLPLEERPDLGAPPAELPWLQPYPDQLLDQAAPSDAEPDAVVVSRETIELAYLAAIQHLPPRQRAILILRDALGWSAKDTAGLLETSVTSVNSALHDPVRALHPSHLAELPGPAPVPGHGRQPAAGGGRLPPAGGRRPLPAPGAQRPGGPGRAGERDHLLRHRAAGGVRPPPDAPGRPMSFRSIGVQAEAGRRHPQTKEVP